jgi:hypothetical protein
MIRRAMRRERDAWRELGGRLVEVARVEGHGCMHPAPVPVYAQPTDELVAHLCPACDAQLPADWPPVRRSITVKPRPMPSSDPFLGGPEVGFRQRPATGTWPPYLEAGERVIRMSR